MDPRRFLILAASGLMLSGCALFPAPMEPLAGSGAGTIVAAAPVAAYVPAGVDPVAEMIDSPALETRVAERVAPFALTSVSIPEPTRLLSRLVPGRPYLEETSAAAPVLPTSRRSGRDAIAAANAAARAASSSDDFIGGVQVFAWSPGRVFEVWTAPLRVTTLTLSPGETILSKAAGDTIRWQIGEASSGSGASTRTHVMLKPLERGLETNLILTTNRRVYLIDLRSGAPDAFNAAVAWDNPEPASEAVPAVNAAAIGQVRVPDPVVMPEGPLDGRYRIEPQGRRPRWTPTAVFNDGLRTFITFDPDLQVDEAPVLFVVASDGEAQLVNYRQVGGLFVVDRVFDRAELRLGDRRPQVVRIRRLTGDRS